MKIILTIPYVVPSQNETDHWHWAKKKATSKKYVDCISTLMLALPLEVRRSLPPSQLVHVSILSKRCRTLDYGNLVGGCKILVDALRYSGLIRNDDTLSIQESYAQEVAKKPGRETIISVSWGGDETTYRVELNSRGL